MPSRSRAAIPFTCPICLEAGGKKTREHLPFKALYKRSGTKSQDNPAIVSVCQKCNNQKSIWDHEILAQYGHIMDIDRAKKAQQSIQNPSELSNTLQIAVAVSRVATHDETMRDIRYRGIPADTISQWMSYCAPGIYMFFEDIPFRGIGFSPIPSVIDLNIEADRFEFPSESHHHINASCTIGLLQRTDDFPKAAIVYIRSPENRLFSFCTFLFEDEKQRKAPKQYKPNVAEARPLRVATSRDIFEIERTGDGYSYRGVKKLKS